jgi:hypothetical protein
MPHMKPILSSFNIGRRSLVVALAALATLSAPLLPVSASAQTATAGDPLASWNDGAAKKAILAFVRGVASDVHAGDVLLGARPDGR